MSGKKTEYHVIWIPPNGPIQYIEADGMRGAINKVRIAVTGHGGIGFINRDGTDIRRYEQDKDGIARGVTL